MIPNILHFVFGMAPDFGGKPFSLVHYLSIRSAVELNRPDAVIFHYQYEPEGIWWEKAKPLVTLRQIKAPEEIMGNPLKHVAHQADVVRLRALQESGGIYLDLDTISVKPLSSLLEAEFVIGQELKAAFVPRNWRQRLKKKLGWIKAGAASTGLCNAVLLSAPNSRFVNRWLESYKNFRSAGRDKFWNEHSVLVPQQLAALYPDELTQLGPYAFHYPLYNEEGLRMMFAEQHDFPKAFLHHLWESFAWEKYMKALSPEEIMQTDSTYNLIARKYL